MLIEALSSLAYSMFGLVVGFAVGRATREVHEVKEVVCPDEHTGHVHPAHEKPSPKKKKQGAWMSVMQSRSLGIMLVVLAMVTVIISTLGIIEDRQQTMCFREYNVAFIETFNRRAAAADKDRKAFNDLLYSLDNPDSAARRQSFREYLEVLEQTDKERKANPLPSPPDPTEYCT